MILGLRTNVGIITHKLSLIFVSGLVREPIHGGWSTCGQLGVAGHISHHPSPLGILAEVDVNWSQTAAPTSGEPPMPYYAASE